jgi:hypothetical protein
LHYRHFLTVILSALLLEKLIVWMKVFKDIRRPLHMLPQTDQPKKLQENGQPHLESQEDDSDLLGIERAFSQTLNTSTDKQTSGIASRSNEIWRKTFNLIQKWRRGTLLRAGLPMTWLIWKFLSGGV